MNTLSLTPVSSSLEFTFVAKAVAFVRKEIKARAAIDALSRLDDRALADIGITRGDIKNAVRGSRSAR